MASNSKKPSAIFWVDLECDGLIPEPVNGVVDYNQLNILEVAVLITNLQLEPITGYKEAVKMTRAAADNIKANPEVLDMHRGSGLVQACVESAKTISEIEDEIIAMLDEEVPGISFYIGGSGVAAYDHPIIKALMPKIAARLHYAPYDIGIARRMSKTMTNRDVVNIPRSYQDGVKTHRAWDDITAHFEEGVAFQTFFEKAVQLGAHNG